MTEGNVFTLSTISGGVPRTRSVWGGVGVPHPRSGWGVPCPRSGWGGTPSQVWGVTQPGLDGGQGTTLARSEPHSKHLLRRAMNKNELGLLV